LPIDTRGNNEGKAFFNISTGVSLERCELRNDEASENALGSLIPHVVGVSLQ
jgi:hypothetical protein